MPSFAIRLAEARVKAGMMKKDCAKQLGVSLETLRKWEHGTRPHQHQLVKLADFMKEDAIALRKELFG